MTGDIRTQFRRSGRAFLELFSVVMLLDRNLRVLFASEILQARVPGLDKQPLLSEVFDTVRPRAVKNYGEAVSHIRSLFLLTSVDGEFAVRGQLLQESYAGQDYLVFCGAPWLSWMVANRPEVKLGLQDFSPQDVQLDQLFYMSTEARMVADLEQMNAQLKEAKEQVESAQATKNAFFARMSHEMRTPLNGVVSALALMRDEVPDGKTGELLDLASKSASNLMEVINYVLDVSKLESAESAPEEVEFDLRELLGTVSDVVRARALEKGLELRTRCDPALPRRCIGDATRLRQTLLNLVTNAIKFTDRGSVTVKVGLSRGAGRSIRFEVQDAGEGIAQDEQTTIFEPFNSVSRGGESGTGLGLDIARRNVEAMGGEIGVVSTPGVGSTFWIELPLPAVYDDTSAPVASSARQEPEEMRFNGNVLLVDDNETNLMLGTMILESMGVTVSQAPSGEKAVQKALGAEYDLVLMDISMPGIDGHEATRRIRKWRDAETLPIVALTAFASSVEQAESESSGMNAYLTKPIERERLAEVLTKWLEKVESPERRTSDGLGARGELSQVDMAALQSLLRQIGPGNLDKVIGKFSREAGQRWLALEAAADARNLAREAHTLASTCRSFGLPGIADRLNQVEAQARSPGTVEPPCLDKIGGELKSALLELKSVVAALCPAGSKPGSNGAGIDRTGG